jgi:F0F1-type ATP synthase delta subunit
MKEEMRYRINWIKNDIKNNWDALDTNQQLIYLNQQLEKLYDLGVIANNKKLCEVIEKYRTEQKQQEEKLIEIQKKIIENGKNILKHILEDL